MIGWPFAILIIIVLILISYFSLRADRLYKQKKIDIVREKLARADRRKRAAQEQAKTPKPDKHP